MDTQLRYAKAIKAVSDGIRDLMADFHVVMDDGQTAKVPCMWAEEKHFRQYCEQRSAILPILRLCTAGLKADPLMPTKWATDFEVQFYSHRVEDGYQVQEQLIGTFGYEPVTVSQKDGKAAHVFLKTWDPDTKTMVLRAIMDHYEEQE